MTTSRGKSLPARLHEDNADHNSTGSVILGWVIASARQSYKASGNTLMDDKVVFLGGGSAAVV